MREIKFRAWDEQKVLAYGVGVSEPGRFLHRRRDYADGRMVVCPARCAQWKFRKEWRTLEGTAIHRPRRQNGKEIYEGDVVEFEEPRMESDV